MPVPNHPDIQGLCVTTNKLSSWSVATHYRPPYKMPHDKALILLGDTSNTCSMGVKSPARSLSHSCDVSLSAHARRCLFTSEPGGRGNEGRRYPERIKVNNARSLERSRQQGLKRMCVRKAYESTSLHMAALIFHHRCCMIELQHSCCSRRGSTSWGRGAYFQKVFSLGEGGVRGKLSDHSTTSPLDGVAIKDVSG